jgi:sialidase-1
MNWYFLFIFLLNGLIVYSQYKTVPVFVSGKDGHKVYRIPAIISLPTGELLAFCEGRVNDAGDFGDINIVMKRSADQGKSWSALETVVDYEKLQAGNPAPVVDLTDPVFPGGRIFLFYNTGNNHENEIRKGKGIREVWYKTSADGGRSWSEPVNITTQVHRPKMPQVNSQYNFPADWRSYANTPGHAMQFRKGVYKNRIFVAANHSFNEPMQKFKDYDAHGFFTDDHGRTFNLASSLAWPGSNESTAAELSNGKLMMNSRNQAGDVKQRIISLSRSGGQRWDTTYFDNNLPDPICEGSLLTIRYKKHKNILAFCNAASNTRRDSLTLRISFDDGKTWKNKYLIDADGSKLDYTSYSDIVNIDKRTIGILYEKANYSSIVFVAVSWK